MPLNTQYVKELREKRVKLIKDAEEILAKGEAITAEEEARFDKLHADADALKRQIDRHEKQGDAETELEAGLDLRGILPNSDGGKKPNSDDPKAAYHRAFSEYVRFGLQGVSAESRQVLARGREDIPAEFRAQTITTTGGGYTIAEGFMSELDKALLEFGGIRSLARVIRTAGGNPLPWPNMDDTGNKAVLTTINTQTTETNLVFGTKQLDAFAFRSLILLPYELMQDTSINLEGEVRAALAERIARGTATYFATGTGSSQPQGVVGAATAGYTAAASTAVAYDDLVELEHSVDPSYRRMPSTGWAFADSTLKSIKKLKDGENRPLWTAGLAVREPDTILGYRYAIDQDLADIEASAKSILFGDWSKFIIRDVSTMIMLRLTERYADYGQVGFFVFSRHDSELLDAGTHPIKYLLHPSP
jgi:HK97 family phage major capsid protein